MSRRKEAAAEAVKEQEQNRGAIEAGDRSRNQRKGSYGGELELHSTCVAARLCVQREQEGHVRRHPGIGTLPSLSSTYFLLALLVFASYCSLPVLSSACFFLEKSDVAGSCLCPFGLPSVIRFAGWSLKD